MAPLGSVIVIVDRNERVVQAGDYYIHDALRPYMWPATRSSPPCGQSYWIIWKDRSNHNGVGSLLRVTANTSVEDEHSLTQIGQGFG
ncbi:hypothetical protein BC938DRAFT_474344 [Jimgerdemannia flammicorona]|uniref:Uncharacterized protein n=1 Tax=Jimgerdemannia flammicorona TaxID=994334 RepID=A0A433QSL6_9FUNG|nr:hypothetical protein BC938DRAFT_474344 [Jimgerdemannia flammicorona]